MLQKYFTSILFTLLPILAIAQPYFSKYYDPFDHATEKVKDLDIVGDKIYLANRGSCNDFEDECFKFAIADLEGNLIEAYENDTFESGIHMEIEDGYYYVDGGNEPINDRMYLYRSSLDGSSDTLVILLPPDDRYTYPLNRSMIKTAEHFIVYGTTRDTEDLQSDGDPKVKGIMFWINKSDLTLDTTIIIEPPYEFLRIEDATLDNEGNLLIITFEDGLFPPNNFSGQFKSIYKYNMNKELIWQWTSEPNLPSRIQSSIRVLDNDNIVFSIDDDDYSVSINSIICLDSDGEIVWQNSIDYDSFTSLNISRLEVLANGDLVAIGDIQGAKYKYGTSGFLTRYSQQGEVLHHKVFLLDPGNDVSLPDDWASLSGLTALKELPNSDLIVGGEVWSQYEDPIHGERSDIDMWLMRLDSTGCLTANCDTHQIVRHQTSVCAEPEYRIVDPRNQWNVTTSAGGASYTTSKQRFKKDSILIDNKYYFQIETGETEFGNDWVDFPLYMRECAGELYGRSGADSEEILYFDFNLQVGDTLFLTEYIGVSDLKVIGINNIMYLDGSIRKTMTIEALNGFGHFVMIEGIGSSFFPLTEYQHIAVIDYWNILGCFTHNENMVYVSNLNDSCWPTEVTNEDEVLDITIYPNPTNGLLLIDTDQDVISVEIFDINGQRVYQNPYSRQLDVSDYADGVYILLLKKSNGNVIRNKIVKTK